MVSTPPDGGSASAHGGAGPAVVNVGDELAFGEKRNGNQEWMLECLWRRRHPARVALTLADDVEVIATWVRLLRQAGHDPILISGGIGGTHDDCTREGIARGLGVALERHAECYRLLEQRYAERFTPQRQRMAWLPAGCRLLANPLGAPGFCHQGVYAFPGFPNMLHPMLETLLEHILPASPEPHWTVLEAVLAVGEGDIAMEVEAFSRETPGARVGIYPSTRRARRETTVRIRCPRDDSAAGRAAADFLAGLEARFGDRAQQP